MKVWQLSMNLGEYIRALPHGSRQAFRNELARKHECSVSLIRKWELWPPPQDWDENRVRSRVRRHPADLSSIKITEELTRNQVTRLDLRPECWSE